MDRARRPGLLSLGSPARAQERVKLPHRPSSGPRTGLIRIPDGAAEEGPAAGGAAPGMGPARPAPRRGPGRAFLLLASVLAIFFSPAILGSGQFLFRDSGRMHWPVKRYLAEELSRGHFPEWNPYAGLGSPVVAGAVDAVQHPFNLLLVLLPFGAGFKLWILLSYLVAACGAYAWARRLGLGWHASVAAGLAFSLSGYLVSSSDNMQYLTAAAALPWIFAAAHAFAERGGPGRLALVGCASAFCAAAGDPQAWGIAVFLLPPYLALFPGRVLSRRAALARGAAAFAAALVAAAPFVLPAAAWILHSSRGEPLEAVDYARWNLHPLRLLELLVPRLYATDLAARDADLFETYLGNAWTTEPWVLSIYLGVPVLALALLGALRSRAARLFLAAAGAFAWLAMGPSGGLGPLLRGLPLAGGFRYWEKLFVWTGLLVALACAHGVERLLADRRAALRLGVAMGVAAAVAVALWGAAVALPEAAPASCSAATGSWRRACSGRTSSRGSSRPGSRARCCPPSRSPWRAAASGASSGPSSSQR